MERPPHFPPQRDGQMPAWVYRELCDCVRAICTAMDDHVAAPDPALTEWRRWAAGFLAGLYYRKTAERAAQAARSSMDDHEHPTDKLLRAAAGDAAGAVALAASGEHAGAWAKAVVVRALVGPPMP